LKLKYQSPSVSDLSSVNGGAALSHPCVLNANLMTGPAQCLLLPLNDVFFVCGPGWHCRLWHAPEGVGLRVTRSQGVWRSPRHLPNTCSPQMKMRQQRRRGWASATPRGARVLRQLQIRGYGLQREGDLMNLCAPPPPMRRSVFQYNTACLCRGLP